MSVFRNYMKGQEMEKVIQIQVRQVYGVSQAYPANEQAKLLALIAGTKTLKPESLAYAERMGFSIEQVEAEVFQWSNSANAVRRFA